MVRRRSSSTTERRSVVHRLPSFLTSSTRSTKSTRSSISTSHTEDSKLNGIALAAAVAAAADRATADANKNCDATAAIPLHHSNGERGKSRKDVDISVITGGCYYYSYGGSCVKMNLRNGDQTSSTAGGKDNDRIVSEVDNQIENKNSFEKFLKGGKHVKNTPQIIFPSKKSPTSVTPTTSKKIIKNKNKNQIHCEEQHKPTENWESFSVSSKKLNWESKEYITQKNHQTLKHQRRHTYTPHASKSSDDLSWPSLSKFSKEGFSGVEENPAPPPTTKTVRFKGTKTIMGRVNVKREKMSTQDIKKIFEEPSKTNAEIPVSSFSSSSSSAFSSSSFRRSASFTARKRGFGIFRQSFVEMQRENVETSEFGMFDDIASLSSRQSQFDERSSSQRGYI